MMKCRLNSNHNQQKGISIKLKFLQLHILYNSKRKLFRNLVLAAMKHLEY